MHDRGVRRSKNLFILKFYVSKIIPIFCLADGVHFFYLMSHFALDKDPL